MQMQLKSEGKRYSYESSLWRKAIICFELGLVYCISNVIVFFSYMKTTDLAYYQYRDDYYGGGTETREIYMYTVIIVPVVFLLIDFIFFNKMDYPASHSSIIVALNLLFAVALIGH